MSFSLGYLLHLLLTTSVTYYIHSYVDYVFTNKLAIRHTGIDQKFQVIFHVWEIKSLRNTCIQVIILIFDTLFSTHSIHQCIWSCSYRNIKSACISSFWKHTHLLSSLSYSAETTVHRSSLCCQEAHIQVEGRERNVKTPLQYNTTHTTL